MFKTILSLFQPKEKPTAFTKQWRTGMWVVFNTKPYILHKLDTLCEIHGVDGVSGETVEVVPVLLEQLRQATYDEIPTVRRNISREQAKELGYGS